MAYIEGGRYQSSAAMGSSCQELSNGLLLDKNGITILKGTDLNVSNDTTIKVNGVIKTLKTENKTVKKNEFISWSDLANNASFVKPFTSTQLSAINHYRAKYQLNKSLYFIVLATMPDSEELTQYTLKGDVAQSVIKAYNKHRYNKDLTEKENFDFLNNFVHSYLEGRTLEISHPQADNIKIRITVSQVYIYSIPRDDTKPLYATRRGTRSKNRGKKKK
jgi:hypothetical protein